ncbi:hypothetical protein [Chitinophaga sp. GbtcB8]|uniref:hypothetical protein n=1 Tax=Chitinophaga sp. GbtcB8 TaxID=2824753 RepID=UPI001C2FE721|nr:hypothetical protein [Chitinophaga sp. GbtcB8]
MAQLRESILKVVAYFDLFNYPVTLEEIRHFLDQPVHGDDLPAALESLLDKQLLWQHGHYYSCKNDPQLVDRRKQGNQMAVKQLKKAMRVARVLSWFPYVRGVGISGSLSKNFAYKGSDLDFFIITAANRLWIARTFLLLFAKVTTVLFFQRLCCLNYYVDEDALLVEEENIFTAIEVVTLLPARGKRSFERFFSSNRWVYKYLPNSSFRTPAKELSKGIVKQGIEWMLNNKLGNGLDTWLMERFSSHWQEQLKLNRLTPTGIPKGAVVAKKHLCKPVAHHFQQKILSRYQENVNTIKAKYTLVMD